MKASVITVCLNSQKTLRQAINSVNIQSLNQVEHIIIDGESADNTYRIAKELACRNPVIIKEKDNGIYDAMNKGVACASGDFICFLNSDDWYPNKTVLEEVADSLTKTNLDFVYGNIKIFNRNPTYCREWQCRPLDFNNSNFIQIPHPAFFVRSEIIKSLLQPFDTSFRIAADLKQQLILILKQKRSGFFIPKVLTHMLGGGASSKNIISWYRGFDESIKAYNDVFNSGGSYFALKKSLSHMMQLLISNKT